MRAVDDARAVNRTRRIATTAWARAAGLAFMLFACAARADIALLNERLRQELETLDAFARQRSGVASASRVERGRCWMLHGRLGPLRAHSEFDSDTPDLRFGLGRGGPSLGARIGIGIYRRFD